MRAERRAPALRGPIFIAQSWISALRATDFLQAHQWCAPRQLYHDSPRYFIVPALLVVVPDDPEKAKEKHDNGESSRQAAHQGHRERKRLSIHSSHFETKND